MRQLIKSELLRGLSTSTEFSNVYFIAFRIYFFFMLFKNIFRNELLLFLKYSIVDAKVQCTNRKVTGLWNVSCPQELANGFQILDAAAVVARDALANRTPF